ncbi:hypothetical protein KUV28_21085 [Ferrimonas balearica]|nr:hypothetical protein [Ferrimonas balearica]
MDNAFFLLSKLVGGLLQPDTWIVIAFGVILLALATHRRGIALWLSSFFCVSFLLLGLLPLGDLLLRPIELQYPVRPVLDDVQGIVQLGGGEDARASAF